MVEELINSALPYSAYSAFAALSGNTDSDLKKHKAASVLIKVSGIVLISIKLFYPTKLFGIVVQDSCTHVTICILYDILTACEERGKLAVTP